MIVLLGSGSFLVDREANIKATTDSEILSPQGDAAACAIHRS